MCEFVSWISFQGDVYVLQDSDLDTKEGEKLLHPSVISDIDGHGAIQSYYPELEGKGTHEECPDFSYPRYFPKKIYNLLKTGRLSRIAAVSGHLNNLASQILTPAAYRRWWKAASEYDDDGKAIQFNRILRRATNRKIGWRGAYPKDTSKKIKVGSMVTITRPSSPEERAVSPTWISDMDRYDGQTMRVGFVRHDGCVSIGSWDFHPSWVTKIKDRA